MGRITHAYITYTDDTKKFFTVPVTNIKLNKNSETHIEPENDTDFEKRRRYYVKWSDCDAECIEDHAHFGYYSAYIIYLGVNNDISHEEGTGCSTTSTCHTMNKPIITRNEPINMNLKMLQKSNINHDKSTERNVEKKNTGRNNNNVIVRVGGSTEQSSTRMVTNVFYRKVNNANRSEAVPVEVHPRIDDDDLLNESDDQQDDDNVEQVPVREHLPLRGKKRNQVNNEGGPRKKVHRELLEALEYYENQEADPGERKRYEIAGNMIYLGEGLEVSAPVWFLIQQDKPQIFFSGMLELLWTHRNLVNRCQNMDKVTTRLQGRSPMKVLTPSKKRLSFSLYSDYLDKKKIKGTEKMQCLSKVPYLITTKINYLRSKYYEKAT